MRIEKYLNTTKAEVGAKKHNIWVGISLGNKYFTKENIQEYIEWALENTREDVLVVVVDAIQAFNLEVLDNRTTGGAYRRALKIGDEKIKEVEEILEFLPEESRNKIIIARWNDVASTKTYKEKLKITKEYFEQDKEFYDLIIEIVRTGRKDRESRLNRLSLKEVEILAEYVLSELPHFVDGVRGHNGKVYTLLPYPGLSKLDELFIGLNNKTMFSKLTDKLEITNKIAIVEAYVD